MDFALSSSTVLGAAVLVWLLWVAPYFLRRRAAEQPAGEAALLMESMEPLRREATPSTSSGTGGSSAAPAPRARCPAVRRSRACASAGDGSPWPLRASAPSWRPWSPSSS
ncbi:hypothetical protein [Sinomonas atrocyanea]